MVGESKIHFYVYTCYTSLHQIFKVCTLLSEYTEWDVERNYSDHMALLKSPNSKSCTREPLLKINADCCPPDILHLKKAIITKLLNQVVDWVILQGNESKLMDEIHKNKIKFRLDSFHEQSLMLLLY